MEDEIRIETELFAFREEAGLASPVSFGEDLAEWLHDILEPLANSGFSFSALAQRDSGWMFWALRANDRFCIAVTPGRRTIGAGPAEWRIVVRTEAGFNIIKRLFHKPDREAFARVCDTIRQGLQRNPDIKILS